MGATQAMQVFPYWDEGYRMLREKYKCEAHLAHHLVQNFFNHIAYNWPEDRVVKNPRREFLHGLRGLMVKERAAQRLDSPRKRR